MVVICPKCKIKLKVEDSKISPAGSRFKCPKCSAVLLVKKPTPSVQTKMHLNSTKVLVAHSSQEVLETTSSVLKEQGFKVVTSTDGIDVMVKALNELPFLAIVEVSLPKIYGFEICKKLKSRPETKDMKFILVPSIFDRSKYRRSPASLYGADDYIEAQDIPSLLIEKINKIGTLPDEADKKTEAAQEGPAPAPDAEGTTPEAPEAKPAVSPPASPVETKPSEGKKDEVVEKAKRLSRTILNDIYLYNSAKVMESIKNGTFYSVFQGELKEGQKLYESRIPQETRNSGDYYRETIEEFIAKKKKE